MIYYLSIYDRIADLLISKFGFKSEYKRNKFSEKVETFINHKLFYTKEQEIESEKKSSEKMYVTVFFETTKPLYAELIASFECEETYLACLPALEKQAQKKGFDLVTESLNNTPNGF